MALSVPAAAQPVNNAALTRRELILRGALALAAGPPLLTRLSEDVAAAGPARSWSLGAFVNPDNERLTFAAAAMFPTVVPE